MRQKNLFILGALEGSNDFSFSGFCVFPTFNFNPLAFFEVFVVLEEVSDLRFQQLWQIVNVFNVIVFFAQLGVRNSNQFRIFTGFVGAIYNGVTGYFGDILSYSRLMALMLAGSVIAQVFNTLGAIPGNIIVFIIISMAGNALNFALNLLGCYVHDLRLQCLEYFGKFYQDGGKPFRPMAVNTRYVDIKEQ